MISSDRDKLVFNICQNKANNFSRETLLFRNSSGGVPESIVSRTRVILVKTLHQKFFIHKEGARRVSVTQ